METAVTGLMLFMACSTAAYDPFLERSHYPPDDVLRVWTANNQSYMAALRALKNELNDPLTTMRPNDPMQEAGNKWLDEELQETYRIYWVMHWIRVLGPAPSPPPTYKQLMEWLPPAKSHMRPHERAAQYIPWGGIPEPGWRDRR